MEYRVFGRLGWRISEVGYGMWGMGEWTGSDDTESLRSLQQAVDIGCNFFDTAYIYGEGYIHGEGHSERLLGELLRRNSGKRLYVATKIPPKNLAWPSRPEFRIEDVFPRDHIFKITEMSLENLGVDVIDLMQFHVWEDAWVENESWQRAVDDLKGQGLIRAMGISVNTGQPWNGMEALRTGHFDSAQVVYNIFDQSAEDELFPLCEELSIGVIARVPLDEGALTGKLSRHTSWPEEDWRNSYFTPENLIASVERANVLLPLIPEDMTMAQMALRYILANPSVSTTIPGMRKLNHVHENLSVSDGRSLPASLLERLRRHRWDRDSNR